MRYRSALWLSLVLLTASGCIQAENGLISPDEREAVFEPDLVGHWETTHTDSILQETNKTYLKVERDHPGSKAYRVTECGEDGKPVLIAPGQPPKVTFRAFLVRLDGNLFLDIPITTSVFESHPESGQQKYHFIFRMSQTNDQMVLRGLQRDYLFDHPESLPCVVSEKLPLWKLSAFDLRLMFDAKDLKDLPEKGQSLIAVACGGSSPQVRIFDRSGKMVYNLDLARLDDAGPAVSRLKQLLEEARPPQKLTPESKTAILTQFRSIHASSGRSRILATPQEWRDFVTKHARDNSAWDKPADQMVLRRR